MKTKAVFFDLFETLITEFSDGQRLSKRNYDYSKLLGITNEEFKLEWRKRQEKRMNGQFESYIDVMRDIVECKHVQVSDDVIQYLFQERIKEKMIPFQHIDPKILALLEKLKHNNIKLGLISNCTEEEVRYWSNSKLAAYFDDCMFSFEVKCSKPDKRIYLLACDRLHVTPEESLFVGDGGSNELEGASKAGLQAYHAVWFNPYIPSDHIKLSSPNELLKQLD